MGKLVVSEVMCLAGKVILPVRREQAGTGLSTRCVLPRWGQSRTVARHLVDVDVVTQPAGPQALPPALFAHCTFKPTILAPSKLLVRNHQCDIGPAPETWGTPLRAPKEIKGQRREKQKHVHILGCMCVTRKGSSPDTHQLVSR